jgi:CRISPR/Cas system-associated exonuclease Cas4 (RecB family)
VAEREFYPTFKKFAFAPDVNFAETDWKDAHTARTAFEDFLARTIETLKSNNLISPLNIVEHRFGTYQNPLDIGDGLGLTGGLDLLSPAYDKWRLVDYKSSLNAQNIDLDQLVLYQIGAVTQLKIRPAMAGFLLIRYSSINWTCIDEARENDLRQRLIQFKDNVADSKFDATPSERACKRCDYRDLCPAYAASKGLPPPKPKQYDVSHEIPEM